ncbi:MAG: glutathione S-transferase family protein [Gammaproteobacteria bacterium]|nr:MAG: glutathione S-transferase family protein [Gammaproteobacteria bacterium]UCH40069.1 MAG: glutathione S-transferase family protein [Gammaproteobacteria bacterium]
MSLHLISFKTCPFVQRAVITLKHKNIDFDITYIDLANPPDWFLEISPLAKVPVLKVDDEILFESAVINEYLDEITGGELQPRDPLARAKNRAWIEFASNMLGNLYMMKMSKDHERYNKYRDLLVRQMQRVEKRLGDGPWFNGEQFTLADTAFAPLFKQDSVADSKLSVIDPATMPKVQAWAERLLALPEVRDSVVDEFEDLYLAAMEKNGSYSLNRLAA